MNINEDFKKEPMRTEIKTIDGVNVLFQYGKVVPSFDTYKGVDAPRQHISLNGIWKYRFDKENRGLEEKWFEKNYDDSNWLIHEIPSTWDLYDVKDFGSETGQYGIGTPFQDGYAWFRTEFTADALLLEKKVRLNFLGVNYAAWVFVNGHYADVHVGGHTYFSLDVSSYLEPGRNSVAVRVFRRPWYENYLGEKDEGKIIDPYAVPGNTVDYWPYAGITRDVYIEAVSPLAIDKLLTNAHDNRLEVYAVVTNDSDKTEKITVLFDSGFGTALEEAAIQAGETRVIKKVMGLKAQAWTVETPVTYTAKVELVQDALIDCLSVVYGMRKVEIQDTALLINGTTVFLKGTNWHEETAQNGRSMKKAEYDLQFGLMKEMGINFIRNSHYNKHPYAYEYADQFGLMVMDETENMWLSEEMIENQYLETKLSRALVCLTTWNNMNHPSVIIWSLLNEPGSDGAHYADFVTELKDVTKRLDVQNRPVGSGHFKGGDDPAASILDIIGWNEYFGAFGGYWADVNKLGEALDGLHAKFPNKPILISENGAWSKFGVKGDPKDRDNENWQAGLFTDNFRQVTERKFMIGYTYWVFKDYKSRAFYTRGNNGISGMGIVPFAFSRQFINECNKKGIEPYKENYHAIKAGKL